MAARFYDNLYLLLLTLGVILVAGLSAFLNLPRLEDPRITHRNPIVITLYPGASAARVEAQVTKPLEDALAGFFEIKDIHSTSRSGISVINVELADWVDAANNELIFSKIRDEVEQVAKGFPQAVQKPLFDDKRKASAYTLVVSLGVDERNPWLSLRFAQALADRFRNQAGTEWVRLFGAPKEEILIEVDQQKLASTGLSLTALQQMIADSDPGGSAGVLDTRSQQILLEVSGSFEQLEQLNNLLLLTRADGSGIQLKDVANIQKSVQDPRLELGLDQGEPVLFVAARMQANLRIEQWTQAALKNLEDFKANFGQDVDIQVAYKQQIYTDRTLKALGYNLKSGIFVVMCVVLVFMGWRLAMIVGLSLPLCLAATLFALGFFGEQIHQMTIFGMIVAIGLLIDNAIVVTNEIRINRFDRGLAGRDALIQSVQHLKRPLLASSVTTILGFMPIFLLTGNVGDFIGPIAIAVVLALIFSYLLCISVIAALAALGPLPKQTRQDVWWRQGVRVKAVTDAFKRLLTYSLKQPKLTLLVSFVLPLVGFWLASNLENVFFPSADRDHFEVKVWLPKDTAIDKTAAITEQMDTIIRAYGEVARVTWMVGSYHPDVYYNQIGNQDNAPYYAHGVVYTQNLHQATSLMARLQQRLQQDFPSAQVVVKPFGQGPPTASPIEFRIYGEDPYRLSQYAQQVRLAMSQVPGLVAHRQSISNNQPKLWFQVNEVTLKQLGLSHVELANHIQAATSGATVGEFFELTQVLPIKLRLARDALQVPSQLESLLIPLVQAGSTNWVPLSTLGQWKTLATQDAITRKNGQRSVVIQGFISNDVTPLDVSAAIHARLQAQEFELAEGYSWELGGDADQQSQAFAQLTQYVPVLLMLLVSTLVLTFRSVSLAMLVLSVAVLSAGLGMFSLWLGGYPMGFVPMIGTTGLIGVAINDVIIVLAALESNKLARAGNLEAIIETTLGTSRHVLSTTLTTVGGFLPLLLEGGSFWPPLATVMAGGICFASYLALIFTPTVYLMLFRLKQRCIKARSRLAGVR